MGGNTALSGEGPWAMALLEIMGGNTTLFDEGRWVMALLKIIRWGKTAEVIMRSTEK